MNVTVRDKMANYHSCTRRAGQTSLNWGGVESKHRLQQSVDFQFISKWETSWFSDCAVTSPIHHGVQTITESYFLHFCFPSSEIPAIKATGVPTSNGKVKKHYYSYNKQWMNSSHAQDWEPAAGPIRRGISLHPLLFKCNITLGFLPSGFLCVYVGGGKGGHDGVVWHLDIWRFQSTTIFFLDENVFKMIGGIHILCQRQETILIRQRPVTAPTADVSNIVPYHFQHTDK